jgi:hypothetical protein
MADPAADITQPGDRVLWFAQQFIAHKKQQHSVEAMDRMHCRFLLNAK